MDGVGRTRIDLDTDELFTSVRRPIGIDSFGLNQIVLRPRQRLRVHRHARQDEVYVVFAGELTVELEGGALETLGPGDVLGIRHDVRRQLSNRGAEKCVVLALGAAGEHESRDGEAFLDWSESDPRPPAEVPLPDDLPA